MAKYIRWRVTKAHHDFIKKHQAHITRKELARMFNEKFGLSVSVPSIASYAKRHGMLRVITPLIHKPEHLQYLEDNHGLLPRSQLTDKFNQHFGTSFTVKDIRTVCRRLDLKMEKVRRNHLPVGSVRRRTKYLHIKVGEPDVWRSLHRHTYEEHYGPIPPDYIVMFADGDYDNTDIENLVCVPADASWIINKHSVAKTENPELNRAVMLTAALSVLNKDET
ncbi:HNH endonuclease [Psychrobacter sp. F1192]|uniref:HNH endonuclease n=1 Tax=Psychrobacter coccoides TaxID=2818440 RepID=A0ABS3NKK8_9GAMM|nr:HNH endonuclease signature motif containing protein [Psychrobacter coccoides]MBO1529618.1 HNH endonuclease [Psychrobacter coccoides]